MKKPLFKILFVLALAPALAEGQSGSDTAKTALSGPMVASQNNSVAYDQSHPLKTNDTWLPRWAIDINFLAGKLRQDILMIDLSKSYTESHPTNSTRFAEQEPRFENGTTIGGDIFLDYFFSPNRRWGIGLGAMYLRHTGNLTMDDFRVDYKAVIQSGQDKGKEFRQLIRSTGPVTEEVKIDNINIPVLLKYKWTFAKRGERPGFGLNLEAGPVFGIQNTTSSIAKGHFSYEAVYSLDPNSKNSTIFGYDNSILAGNNPGDPGKSLIITESYYSLHKKDGNDANTTFDDFRKQGKNVGLNKAIAQGSSLQNSAFDKVSFGALIKGGVSYQFTYNISFIVNGYFLYQRWQNTNSNENFRLTENVVNGENNSNSYFADYNAMTGGIRQSDYMAYGGSAGFRIFFGDKPDRDDDGIIDRLDCDMNKWGLRELNGCPDRDNDGIADGQDKCPDAYGLSEFDGCPDSDNDGFPDNIDRCPHEFGTLRGCPVSTASGPIVDTFKTETGMLMAPHVVLETDILRFGFGSSGITDSAVAVLDYAKGVLEKEPEVIIYISGHTDDIGNERNNLFLSYQRAKAAKDYLISKGISKDRVIIGSYGKENPIVPNDSPESRARNRRSELKLLLPIK